MDDLQVRVGEVLHLDHRRGRNLRVTQRLHDAVGDLREVLVDAARARGTVTYTEASEATGRAYPARGMTPVLDLLSEDCRRRGEPTLAALVVRKDVGEVGLGYGACASVDREDCYRFWRVTPR